MYDVTMAQHQPWQPPSAEQVSEHLRSYALRDPSPIFRWLPVIALTGAVVLSLTVPNLVTAPLPWLVLAVTLIVLCIRVHRVRRLERQVQHVEELAMLRHHAAALSCCWALLPKVATSPSAHGRVVVLIAYSLDELKYYDAAISAYDGLIDELSDEHPGRVQLQIQRAMVQLHADYLTDAHDALRRLHHIVESLKNASVNAIYCLAQLMQKVRTRHFADAVASADHLLEDLRPLGVEAAFGHALMALSYHGLADSSAERNARIWWSRATLLMPAAALLDRFGELHELAQTEPVSTDSFEGQSET